MSHPPEGLLDRPLLKQLAGEKLFALGEAYFAGGQVRQVQAATDRVIARVEGSRAYRVKIWKSRGELQHSCTCPAGREHAFCKHCVAVGLAWLALPEAGGAPSAERAGEPEREGSRSRETAQAREQLDNHLRTIERERLISLLLEATDYDDILRRRLQLEAAGVSRPGAPRKNQPPRVTPPDFEAYGRLLREAIETADYVDYEAMPDYAQGVQEAVQPLAGLLRDGFAATVLELAEFALIELDKVSDLIDGGDGSLNAIYDDLQRYHQEACRAARPNPEELAARLLRYEIEGGLGVFNNAVKAYADILGETGTAAWRRLLINEWSSLPPLGAAGGAAPAGIDHRRFQLQALMERLGEAEGDIAALIRIREADLGSAHDYLALAQLHESAGQPEQALVRAEEGLRWHPLADDAAGLRDFLAEAYQRAGRFEEARALVWEAFTRHGDLEHYRALRAQVQANAVGREWSAWRKRALDHLRGRAARDRAVAERHGWSHRPDHTVLVEILLDERHYDEAWREAVSGGCRADLWLRLAVKREKKHPGDALRVYQARLEPTIAQGGQTAYREAVELLDKIRALLDQLGRSGDFAPYQAEIRAAHRQKRSFLKLLDGSDR